MSNLTKKQQDEALAQLEGFKVGALRKNVRDATCVTVTVDLTKHEDVRDDNQEILDLTMIYMHLAQGLKMSEASFTVLRRDGDKVLVEVEIL